MVCLVNVFRKCFMSMYIVYVLLGYLLFPTSPPPPPPPPIPTASSITVGCVPIHVSVYVHISLCIIPV